MNSINLRVFRRTLNDITLLWDTKDLTEDAKNNVEIFVVLKTKLKSLQFIKDSDIDKTAGKLKEDVLGVIIDHELNGLEKHKTYTFIIKLGKENPKEYQVVVLPYGVLPDAERDKKSANVHFFGWNIEDKEWVKIPVVKDKKGKWVIPVKIVE